MNNVELLFIFSPDVLRKLSRFIFLGINHK